MNKGISTPIAIIIIVVCAGLTGLIVWQYRPISNIGPNGPSPTPPEDEIADLTGKEQTCINSGGVITTSLCCKATSDYPNLCLIGPCGCSPENSHEVKICDCGFDKCFNGNECVSTCPTCSE